MGENCSSSEGILNLSNPQAAIDIQPTTTEKLSVYVVMPLILLIGVLGNVAFILAVVRVPRMQILTNTYLAQVAVCDIIFVISATISYIHTQWGSRVRFAVKYTHWTGCFSAFYFTLLTYFMSLFLMTLVTAERFYAICYPLKWSRIAAAGRSRKLLLTLWITSCLFAGLYVLRFAKLQHICVVWPPEEEYSSFPQNIAFCVVVHPHLYVIAELAQILPFYILLPLNVYMYATIIYSLNKRASSNKTSLT